MSSSHTPRSSLAGRPLPGRRLPAYDGLTLNLPSEADSREEFGLPESGRGQAAFPQAHVTALVEVGTRAAFVGVRAVPEGRAGAGRTLARAPLSGVVTRCRQWFTDAELWRSAVRTSADLQWRVLRDTELAVRGVLSDRSYLTTRAGAGGRVHAGRQPTGSSIPVPSPPTETDAGLEHLARVEIPQRRVESRPELDLNAPASRS